MYSVVLLLAATTSMDATSCHRRNRGYCPPPCCPPPPCCGSQAPRGPGGVVTPPPGAPGKMTAAEEAQLGEVVGILRKNTKMTPAEFTEYDRWFRSLNPNDRTKEYNNVKKEFGASPTPKAAAPLTADEEKMLTQILGVYSLKDAKSGKPRLDEKSLKDYENWFRNSATPAERLKDFKDEVTTPAAPPKPGDKTPGKSSQLDGPAQLLVHVPADAVLTIDGNATRSTSGRRWFESPILAARGVHFYELQATVERFGMVIQVNQLVRVQPGQITEVNIEIPMPQQALTSQR